MDYITLRRPVMSVKLAVLFIKLIPPVIKRRTVFSNKTYLPPDVLKLQTGSVSIIIISNFIYYCFILLILNCIYSIHY